MTDTLLPQLGCPCLLLAMGTVPLFPMGIPKDPCENRYLVSKAEEKQKFVLTLLC